jgi:hypothetical protein
VIETEPCPLCGKMNLKSQMFFQGVKIFTCDCVGEGNQIVGATIYPRIVYVHSDALLEVATCGESDCTIREERGGAADDWRKYISVEHINQLIERTDNHTRSMFLAALKGYLGGK